MTYITWLTNDEDDSVEAINSEEEYLGWLAYERVGAHMHWCWYQKEDIRMSPGCLEEVRKKQKELFKSKREKKDDIIR